MLRCLDLLPHRHRPVDTAIEGFAEADPVFFVAAFKAIVVPTYLVAAAFLSAGGKE